MKRRIVARTLGFVVLVAALAARLPAQQPAEWPIAAATTELARGNSAAAIALLDPWLAKPEAIDSANQPRAIEALVLRARAREQKGDDGSAALADLTTADSLGPDRSHAAQIALVRARIHDRLKQRDQALAAARAAADLLLDPTRRRERAQVWLDAAEVFLKPPTDLDPVAKKLFHPNEALAVELLGIALETGSLGSDARRIEIEQLSLMSNREQSSDRRLATAKKWLIETADLSSAQRAKLLKVAGFAALDLRDMAELLAAARAVSLVPDARETAIELWSSIVTPQQDWIPVAENFSVFRESAAELERLAATPTQLESAHLRVAESAILRRDLNHRIEAYRAARRVRPDSPRTAEVEIAIANSLAAQQGSDTAIAHLEAFLAGRSIDSAGTEVTSALRTMLSKRASELLETANGLEGEERSRTLAAAHAAFERYIARFPGADDLSSVMLSQARIKRLESQFDEALTRFAELRTRFPGTSDARTAWMESAAILFEDKKDAAAALALLDLAAAADPELQFAVHDYRATIERPELSFQARRPFRSDEPKKLTLKTRNLENVAISFYPVDLEEYFLATGNFSALSTLDVSLIEPTRSTKLAIGNSASHIAATESIDLGDLPPGKALIVSARGAELEARAIAITTDLDAAVVYTATEWRMFGVDRKNGSKVEIARHRIANSSGTLLPENPVTGKSLTPGELSVLASSEIGLAPLTTDQGPVRPADENPIVSFAIDRSPIRPGEPVHVLGRIVNEHRVPIAEPLEVLLVDAATNLTLLRREVRSDERGAFEVHLPIDAGLDGSRRTLAVELWRGTGVDRKRLVVRNCEVDGSTQSSGLRGFLAGDDLIEGEAGSFYVVAESAIGKPIPDLPLRITLNSEPTRSVRTDEHGSVRIEIPAAQTRDRAWCRLEVKSSSMTFENTYAVTPRTRSLVIERGLGSEHIAGRTLRPRVKLFSAGKPELRVDFRLRRAYAGEWLVVSTGSASTDASGRAEFAIEAKDPGDYELSFEWPDRDGSPLRVSHTFTAHALGAYPDLALCPEQRSLRPGESMDLPVFWPFPTGPALLTVFGADLDRSEVVTLSPGANILTIVGPKAQATTCEITLSALSEVGQTRKLVLSAASSLEVEIAPPIVDASGALRFDVQARAGSNPVGGMFDYVIAEEGVLTELRSTLASFSGSEVSVTRSRLAGVLLGLSADQAFDPITLATDPRISEQLAVMNRTAAEERSKLMVEDLALNDLITARKIPGFEQAEVAGGGEGGGPGGTYRGPGDGGSGHPGRAVGGRREKQPDRAVPAPLSIGFARTLDTLGRATVELPAPTRAGRFGLLVISRDGIATATAVRSFVVTPQRVAPKSNELPVRPRFDGFAISDGTAITLPAAMRSDLTALTVFASPLAALAAVELRGGATDLDVALWQCFSASEAVLMARSQSLDAKILESLSTRRDWSYDHLRATLLGHSTRSGQDTDPNSMLVRRSGAILFVLATARNSGVSIAPEVFTPWIEMLDRTLASATSPAHRALALAGLARAGIVSFERLNRVMRDAESLTRRELALLVLALMDVNRIDEARAMATKLRSRIALDPDVVATSFEVPLSSRVEVDALVVAALRRAFPMDALPAPIAGLFAGTRLVRQDEAGGSLALWLCCSSPVASNFTLRLRSGEAQIEVTVDARDPLSTLDLLEKIRALPAGKVTLIRADDAPFALAYANTQYLAPADPLYSAEVRAVRLEAKRDRSSVPVGDSILAEGRTNDSPHARELAIGRNYQLRVAITRQKGAPRGYWMRIPLPDGLEFVPGSVVNANEYVVDGRTLLAYHGATDSNIARRHLFFQVIPTTARVGVPALQVGVRSGRFESESRLTSTETGFDIVPWDRDIDSSIEATPDERYHAGIAASAAGRHERAFEWLAPLLGRKLNPDASRAIMRAALTSSIALGKDREIVDLFELAKERDPDHVLSFDAMDRVSKAYSAIGEIERAREVLSAIGDALFLQEARAVGRLESANLERMAMTFLDRLLIEHDATATLLETTFAVGQHAYDLGRKLGPTTPNPKIAGQKPLGRDEWLALGKRALEGRLVASGSDAAAEEVALTLGNLFLESGALDDASALASAARTRYANGRFGATWHYVLAYAAFARRDLATAATEAQALIDDASKATDLAIRKLETTGRHMLAQIAHATGDLSTARKLYSQVEDEIADARLALEYLERSGLSLPMVWVSGVDQSLEIPLERKVLESQRGEVEVTLYPVDLRLLYLKKRGFGTLSSVELAGLPSISRTRVKPIADKARGSELVTLGVPAPGAYLVIVRDGDLLARSIAIVSDISIDVVEIRGGARAHVVDRLTRKPVQDVVLTFVGSDTASFVTKKSDLRGIAEASGLTGTLAVIAQRDKQFAYYQGTTALPKAQDAVRQQDRDGAEVQDQADQQLEESRARNDANYRANFNRTQLGVEIQRAQQK